MKTWFEFPESTRFARSGRADILYTPIFFANEGVSAKFCLDNEWSQVCEDNSQFEARVQLIGKASLGFLSIGGQPARSLNATGTFALPSVGFKAIYTLTILDISRTVRLEEGSDNRTPFEFRLQTSTLADLQQIASSLKTITADTASTMDLFKEVSPALIVSVQYALVGTLHYNGEKKAEHDSEIRLFVSLDETQVPAMTPQVIGNNPLAALSQTVYLQMGKSKPMSKGSRKRDSLPLIRRMSRSSSSASTQRVTSSVEEDSYLVVEIDAPEAFCFRVRDEAAAAKLRIKLTYYDSFGAGEEDEDKYPPPKMTATATTLMKSLTSLTLEPALQEGEEPDPTRPDDFFHLRSKVFPVKKNKLTFGDWEKTALSSAAAAAAQNMMQGNGVSPTVESFNGYRLRRSSTMPAAQSIREEPTPASDTATQEVQPTSLTSAQNETNIVIPPVRADTLPTTTTAPPVPPSNAPPPPSLTIPNPPKRWTTSADLWLTYPITLGLTPSFVTPYISHLYTASINLALNPDISTTKSPAKTKAFKTLKSFNPAAKSSIEFNVPVSVRYDVGLVPSYEIDRTLPEYDFSLPGYDDAVGFNPGALESLQAQEATRNRVDQVDSVSEEASTTGIPIARPTPQVIEDPAAYEARVTGSNNAGRITGVAPNLETERHAWRYANIDSNAHGADADDDVLEMLMRNTRVGQPSQTARRVYGDATDARHADADDELG